MAIETNNEIDFKKYVNDIIDEINNSSTSYYGRLSEERTDGELTYLCISIAKKEK